MSLMVIAIVPKAIMYGPLNGYGMLGFAVIEFSEIEFKEIKL